MARPAYGGQARLPDGQARLPDGQARLRDGQTMIKLTATAGQTVLERRMMLGAVEHAYRGLDDAATQAQMQTDLDKERQEVADEVADREKVRTIINSLV